MSLEDITQQYDAIIDGIKKFYNQMNTGVKKEYSYNRAQLQVQDKNAGFQIMKADSIDDILKSGGIVMKDGKTYGTGKDIEDAKYLKNDYEKYKKEIGGAIKELYGKDAEYDGYAFLKLGKNVYAAHIEVDGKKILAVNKDYAKWMDNPVKKREVYGHESMHNIGEKSEMKTDEKNAELNNHLSEKLEHYIAKVYEDAAKYGQERLRQNSYGVMSPVSSY